MSENENRETIADIIAKKRARANRIERNVAENLARGKMTSGWFVRDLIASIRKEADSLEAAWKREKAETESDALNVGAVVATTEKSSAVGNAAAMREALIRARDMLFAWRRDIPFRAWNEIGETIDKCNAAIAEPPRNCDIGAPEEQQERFKTFCDSHWNINKLDDNCKGCPMKDRKGACEFAWAQMPYEADAEKEGGRNGGPNKNFCRERDREQAGLMAAKGETNDQT